MHVREVRDNFTVGGESLEDKEKVGFDNSQLRKWQEKYRKNKMLFEPDRLKMDRREKVFGGSNAINQIVKGDKTGSTGHVRNIIAELVEAQVNSGIPQPKVTPKRPQDDIKAKLIEDLIRNELDRMPFETINDMAERTVPIQGGVLYHVEWDSGKRNVLQSGELSVTMVHPKQVVPQHGIYTGIDDMDYIILEIPQTKEYIKRRYDVDVSNENEDDPYIKSTEANMQSEDLVTQVVIYYRGEDGNIGIYSFVNDTELEDIPDYQARRLSRCEVCGEPEPDEGRCPICGSGDFTDGVEEYEEVYAPIGKSDGSMIPGAETVILDEPEQDENGLPVIDGMGMPVMKTEQKPTRIPYYKPDMYPVVLQRNVSAYGKFLGDSDADRIADQQNTSNRIERKIVDKLLKSGSYMTLPPMADIEADNEDMKVIRIEKPADKEMIDVKTMQGEIDKDLAYLEQVYQEARQIIGITDSFQGRRDTTATSGKAKEFAAAQSAGRLESKRVMKDAAYSRIFELIFKFTLAYADDRMDISSHDETGRPEFKVFNKYDFLEQDETGEWFWNDQFLFSCDTSAPLAANREAMWQETRMNLESGAFGNPTELETIIMFWRKMELLHYPGAGETRAELEERFESMRIQQAQAMQQERAMMMGQMPPGGMAPEMMGGGNMPPDLTQEPQQMPPGL